ncbi:MAG TPA: zf-HC2 domain-containing protein [Pilimelia sp.]|nr:zf-HC2 domain-containing protein [Pilimelia sp.]
MDCEASREALSARLDGEDLPSERAALDAHLASCASCRGWGELAATAGRLLATGLPTPPSPGVPDTVLTAVPRPWRFRAAVVLRWVLGVLGGAQLLLGITQITSLAGGAHAHSGQVASPGHLWHESAAWNLAVGAGFLVIAARRDRPSGVLPMLSVFIAVLALLSLGDLGAGRVQAAWLLSHGFIVAGYVIVVLLGRPGFAFAEPPGGGRVRRWYLDADADADADPAAAPEAARRLPGAPAARHREVA